MGAPPGIFARPGGGSSNLSLSSPSLPFPSSPSLPFLSLLPSPPCPPLPRREAPPLNPGKGPGRASKAPPAGSGAAPLPKTHLGMFSAGESCLVATTLVLFCEPKCRNCSELHYYVRDGGQVPLPLPGGDHATETMIELGF